MWSVALLSIALARGTDVRSRLVSSVCQLPSLAVIPGLLRRPLARVAVDQGLPLIDQDEVLQAHILAGRTNHPLIVQRFAHALDESMAASQQLRVLSRAQQTLLAQAVASVLLTPSAGVSGLFEDLDSRALGLSPCLQTAEERRALATAINEAIDLPGMDEEQEQELFEKMVDQIATWVNRVLPEELRTPLLSGTPGEVDAVRTQLITIVEPEVVRCLPMGMLVRIDGLGLGTELEAVPAKVSAAVVDAVIESIRSARPDELCDPAERLERLDARWDELRAERGRIEAETASLLEGLDLRLEEITAERASLLKSNDTTVRPPRT